MDKIKQYNDFMKILAEYAKSSSTGITNDSSSMQPGPLSEIDDLVAGMYISPTKQAYTKDDILGIITSLPQPGGYIHINDLLNALDTFKQESL